MTLEEVEQLLRELSLAGIAECGYASGGAKIHVVFESSPRESHSEGGAPLRIDPGGVESKQPSDSGIVRATATGVFSFRHPLKSTSHGSVDAKVTAGEVIGYLRVHDVLWPVLATQDGFVAEQIAQDESLVGYGDPLVRVDIR